MKIFDIIGIRDARTQLEMYTTLALYSSLSSPAIDRTTFHSKSEAQTVNVIEQLPLICT